MSTQGNPISVAITVTDVEQAINLYVRTWKLFSVLNAGGTGEGEFAMLEYLDSATPFTLVLEKAGGRDSKGRNRPLAQTARISLPKAGFWRWVDEVFGDSEIVESTPWSADVILTDPFGHMLVIYTTESPD